MKNIFIGKILKPKGLDGTLKITNFTLGELAPCFKSVFIDSKCYRVLRAYCANEFVYFTLEGIDSIEKADGFREKEVFGDRDELDIDDNQFLINDLVGLSVIVGDKKIGTVEGVENYGAGDIFSIRTIRGIVLVPKTPTVVRSVDVEAGFIEFNEDEFNEVKV